VGHIADFSRGLDIHWRSAATPGFATFPAVQHHMRQLLIYLQALDRVRPELFWTPRQS
jgi:hypothetical protein